MYPSVLSEVLKNLIRLIITLGYRYIYIMCWCDYPYSGKWEAGKWRGLTRRRRRNRKQNMCIFVECKLKKHWSHRREKIEHWKYRNTKEQKNKHNAWTTLATYYFHDLPHTRPHIYSHNDIPPDAIVIVLLNWNRVKNEAFTMGDHKWNGLPSRAYPNTVRGLCQQCLP